LALAPTKRFDKDEILVHQDDKPNQIYIVKTGVVRCYDISLDGNQQLIWLASKGEMFPISLLLNTDKKVRFFYSAFTDAEVYLVDKAKLAGFLKANPDILFEVCTEIARKFNDLHHRINAAGKPKAREKILHTLAFVADRFTSYRRSGKRADKRVELSLPLTHQDIANLVGLTRETTAVTLKNLKDEGFVDYDKQRFFVHREKIEKALW
jgi:CRP/FNR family transcriptional regulator, cyclic AMP receptor protein